MKNLLKPLASKSLKEEFIELFEGLILSGEYAVGQRLPPERELGKQLNVSRPVVHEGLVELAARGLVTMIPRRGTVINDYRKAGSLTLLISLVNYHKGSLAPLLLDSLIETRLLIESETARLAALNRKEENIINLKEILEEEKNASPWDVEHHTKFDFAFHHEISLASENLVLPLLLKSFEPAYTNLSGEFFAQNDVLPVVIGFHAGIVKAIEDKDPENAVGIMRDLLEHGKNILKECYPKNKEGRL